MVNLEFLIDAFWRAANQSIDLAMNAFDDLVFHLEVYCDESSKTAPNMAAEFLLTMLSNNNECSELSETLPPDLFSKGQSAILESLRDYLPTITSNDDPLENILKSRRETKTTPSARC